MRGSVWPLLTATYKRLLFLDNRLIFSGSITYNGSMDSPVPLYPTDFPPSYEAVMGLNGDSQVSDPLWRAAVTMGSI